MSEAKATSEQVKYIAQSLHVSRQVAGEYLGGTRIEHLKDLTFAQDSDVILEDHTEVMWNRPVGSTIELKRLLVPVDPTDSSNANGFYPYDGEGSILKYRLSSSKDKLRAHGVVHLPKLPEMEKVRVVTMSALKNKSSIVDTGNKHQQTQEFIDRYYRQELRWLYLRDRLQGRWKNFVANGGGDSRILGVQKLSGCVYALMMQQVLDYCESEHRDEPISDAQIDDALRERYTFVISDFAKSRGHPS